MSRGYSIQKVTQAAGETTVSSEAGSVVGVIINTNGSADVTVLLEDGTSELLTVQAAGADLTRSTPLPGAVKYTTRLDVTVTGAGGSAFIVFGA